MMAPAEKRWLSVDQIAECLDVSKDTVCSWITSIEMPAHRMDKLWKLKGDNKSFRGRLFLVFPNQEALTQLQSLWQRWQSNQSFERDLSKWKDLFSLLRDVRPWNVRDWLLETGVLNDWRERVTHNEETVPCKIEMWFRQDEEIALRFNWTAKLMRALWRKKYHTLLLLP